MDGEGYMTTSLNVDFVREQFPPLKDGWVFLENAGGSYVPRQVIERVTEYMTDSQVQPNWGFASSERATERIVDVDDRGVEAGPREEAFLRDAIGVHRAVVVEVIAREIREHREIERDRVDAALVERVRGDFHRDMRRAPVAERREKALHRDRIGRRARAGDDFAGEAGAERADRRDGMAGAMQRLCEQVHRRCLAIGAGDADDGHRRGRIVEEARRDRPELLAERVDPDRRAACGLALAKLDLLMQNGGRGRCSYFGPLG